MAEETIINRVARSGLITIDLADIIPQPDIAVFDLKPFLFREMILREKEFRAQLKEHDWSPFRNKVAAVTCSADAILPQWAWMLAASELQRVAQRVIFGDRAEAERMLAHEAVEAMDVEPYRGQKVVIKGCGEGELPAAAYLEIVIRLQPVASSIMYGEPCSTVPVWKKRES